MFNKNYVGYKRPPYHRRFQPGRSGNPKGRPKGSKNFATLFEEILSGKVTAHIGNKKKRITLAEAMLRKLANQATTGDLKALNSVVRIGRELGLFDPAPPAEGTYGVIVVPGMMDQEAWEEMARKQQAPYAGNETDGLVKKDEPKKPS